MELPPQMEPLNPRESEILALLTDGLSNREIAQKLHLSLETVKWYNKQLFAKLGVESRTQAAASARKLQLFQNPPASKPTAYATPLNLLVRGRMIGRENEISQLREIWTRSRQMQGHLALISGEPGVGKTRLASEIILTAQQDGAALLRGGCYEFEATTPYLPFVEALREWVHLQPAEVIRTQMADTASELARLAPEIESKIGTLLPNPPLQASDERLRLFDHVTRFLQNLAKDHGLLFFIDDLHWADQGTLSMLAYALRNLRSERVLILAAYREVELDRKHPLAAAMVEWNRERVATRISLGRLNYAETVLLLATLFDEETISAGLAQALYAETEGNPFFIEEVVKALIEQGGIYLENNAWKRKDLSDLAIPQSVKEAVGRRLNRLSQPCLEVLHIAAALGKEFTFSEMALVSGITEDQLLDTLDEASAAQLVRSTSGEGFTFTHDKIREVLYEEINPIRRKRLHQRIGEALEGQSRDGRLIAIQNLAYHFNESGDLPRSLKYSIQAAEKASRLFALDDALHYYEIAHEAAESLEEWNWLTAIRKAIGDIHSQRGQVDLSTQYYRKALDLEKNLEERGAVMARMGSVYTSAGDARGLPIIEEALRYLNPSTQGNEVALATAMLGRYYHYRALHSKAIEHLERARSIAEPLDDAETLSQVYAYLAGAYQHLTRYPESIAWAHKNIALGERKNHPIAAAYGYEFLGEDAYALGNWREAVENGLRDQEIGEKTGARDRVAWGMFIQASGKQGLGDLASAEQTARAARTLAENMGDTRLVIFLDGLLVQILGDLGKEEACTIGEQVLREADELNHIFIQLDSRHSYGYLLLQLGQVERALELYLQAEELVRPTENLWMAMNYRPWMAQAYLELGRSEEASSMAENAISLARNAGSRFKVGLGLRVEAQIQVAVGNWEPALNIIQETIAMMAETESQLELGRSLLIRGNIHQARGDSRAATADWSQALGIFNSLNAQVSAQKARERLEAASS